MSKKINFSPVVIDPTAIVDSGASIGAGTKIWHWAHVCSGAQIGENVTLGQNVFVAGNARIGNGCKIQNNVSVYDNVWMSDNVFCGPSVVFTNVLNPRANVSRKNEYKKTSVHQGATIGANATIVCGNTIGEYAFVGAGAVITRDVAPYSLVIGNPARQVGWISRAGTKLNFNSKIKATTICEETGDLYLLKDNLVKRIEV